MRVILKCLGQLCKKLIQTLVIQKTENPFYMRGLVVPGACNLFVLVPARTYVSMCAMKNGKHVGIFCKSLCMLLVTHYMCTQKNSIIPFFHQAGNMCCDRF